MLWQFWGAFLVSVTKRLAFFFAAALCGMQNLSSQSGIEPGRPALGATGPLGKRLCLLY